MEETNSRSENQLLISEETHRIQREINGSSDNALSTLQNNLNGSSVQRRRGGIFDMPRSGSTNERFSFKPPYDE